MEQKAAIQRQVTQSQERVHTFKEQLQRRKELLRLAVANERQREISQLRKINQELNDSIHKREEALRQQQQMRIQQQKHEEKLLPYKLRYLQQQKQERLKDGLHKSAEVEESAILEKQETIAALELVESRLAQQLRHIHAAHVSRAAPLAPLRPAPTHDHSQDPIQSNLQDNANAHSDIPGYVWVYHGARSIDKVYFVSKSKNDNHAQSFII